MKIKIFYKQMGRSLRTLLTNGVILLVVTAFFVMSLNLYKSSAQNLQLAEDTYRTIAIMELYGDVNERGELSAFGGKDHEGYFSVAVNGYDLDQIINASGVEHYDLRARYAAYIENEPAMNFEADLPGQVISVMADEDIIRFKVAGDEPITIPISWSKDYRKYRETIYLTVLDSAAGCYWYRRSDFECDGIYLRPTEEDHSYYSEQIKKLNRSDETEYITLYPGVEYIAGTWMQSGWHTTEDSKGLLIGSQRFHPSYIDYFSEDFHVSYGAEESIESANGMDAEQPFPIARWEDVENDPILKAQWDGAWEAMKYNTCAHSVCLTDDITGVPVFHLGGGFLADGRMITEEEYATGAKVCMISKQMSQLQGWHVGNKLNMDFFYYEAFPNTNDTSRYLQPIYHKNTEDFFDSGEYEIVGIFDQKDLIGNSGISQSTLTMPWNLIFVPKNSVQNALPEDQLPVHAALLTIWLENGAIDEFLADMDTLGITAKPEGQYHASFTFYDQGYSMIQPGLQNMLSTAKLLLTLSSLLLIITCLLLAYFFANKQKHNVGIFRMLGGRKYQAISAILVCALVIAFLSALPGAAIGHSLSERVGAALLSADSEDIHQNEAYRANVLATQDEATMELSVHADSTLSVVAACSAMLFPFLTLMFMTAYIGKEPRELLPKNKA